MGKVRLTQEQADAIKKLKAEASNKEIIYMNTSPFGGIYLDKDKQTIFEMDLDELIRALYVGYEVEPEFSVGDYVVRKTSEDIGEVKRINENGTIHCNNTMGGNPKHFRHATPEEIAEEKERRWWAKHGRDVWELKQGDILMGIHRALYEVTADPKSHRFGYYTGNDSRDFEIGECKRDGWKVVCFAEDRKDIDAE